MTELLPPHVRPLSFAGSELLLDLVHAARTYFPVDLESLLIVACVNEATMRPFVLDPATPREVLHAPKPPESVRGSISRRMIADKLGLPRETVRRKTSELAAMGVLRVDEEDRVRITQELDNPFAQHLLEEGHRAVLRYVQRLAELGVDWQAIPPLRGEEQP
ncbi:MAG: hypothetical protein HXY28_02860 [Hydrogenophilaceae bacterium]|jgi:hypothetical protein|nr:hypothetical protein [Hydrogenophilaceae bacterium]